jgi:SNF2 family DNA or RNA helicase
MIISEVHRKVVLNLSNPERVTTVIPSAKPFQYKGHTLVAVPHKLEEVRVLRNLGIKAPSPIGYHYDWSGPYTPFKAQYATSEFLTLNPKAFVLNDMGTGKTLSTLWAYDYLRSIGQADKLLVISPLSTLERTWADEVFRHFPHLTVSVVYGTKERRRKMLRQDADIYLINHDGIVSMEVDLREKDFDTVVIDEVASFRNASTTRWKALNRICRDRDRVWGLTGTPTPNLPTDAWAQCRIICPENVPSYFGKFKDMVLKQQGPFKLVPRDNATQIVHDAMQPSIRFSRDDCIDLPECVYLDRAVTMSAEQQKAYREMQAQLATEVTQNKIVAVNEAVKMGKLIQIACGVVYGADGEDVVLPSDNRIGVVKEVIEQSHTKVIVFVPYKGVMRHVAEALASDYSVGVISGDVPKNQRDDIFDSFQNHKNGIQVLVAQPAAMSHGLTLTAASTVIWYAPVTSNEVYQQANARITRPGQKHAQLIVNIEACAVERKVYDRLKKKQSLQGLLLDMVHG